MANLVVGSAVWELGLVKEGFDRAVDQVNTKINSLSDRFKAAEHSSEVFAGALAGLGAVGLGAVGFAVKSAADMEMLRSSLDTLTGSVENGAKTFKDLYDFAAKTPFETTDLAKATQTMLAFGVSNEKIMPNLQMLGDISMGNKDRLGNLSLAFSQVAATGRLMGQDLLQMVNAGFNPLQIISEKTGKSLSDLKEEMEDGQISFEMVSDAMKTATSQGGRFFQGMDRGSKTLSGTWSTLMDVTNMTIRRLAGLSETGDVIQGGLVDKVKNAIAGLTTFLVDNQAKILDFMEATFGWIRDNGTVIAGILIGVLTPAFVGAGIAFMGLLAPLLPFIAAGAAIGLTVKLLVDAFGGWDATLQKLRPVIDAFGIVLNEMILPGLTAIYNQIVSQLLPALSQLWTTLEPILIPVLKALAIVLGVTIIGSIVVLTAAIRILITFFTEIATTANSVAQRVVAAFQWISDNALPPITDLIMAIVEWFKRLPGMISDALTGIGNAITKPFQDAYNSVSGILSNIAGKMQQINPFHRQSPSLVDNVIRGVGIIEREFKSLQGLEFPTAAGLGMAGSKEMTQHINVNIDSITDKQDLQVLGRELGFRASLLPEI